MMHHGKHASLQDSMFVHAHVHTQAQLNQEVTSQQPTSPQQCFLVLEDGIPEKHHTGRQIQQNITEDYEPALKHNVAPEK